MVQIWSIKSIKSILYVITMLFSSVINFLFSLICYLLAVNFMKNFAWNIANPYNISGDATAAFVFNTFNEWFANTTIATIKKNLRTTNGRHKIEIEEKVLAKYMCNDLQK